MIVLETERLRLRWLTLEDAAFILELVNEPGWLRFIGDRGIRTLDDARTYLTNGPVAMYSRIGFGLYAVELKAEGTLIGTCGLLKREVLVDVDLGFAFLARYGGKGFGRESAAAVMAMGRTRFGLKRLVAITAPDNGRSIRLLESLGFGFERMVRFAESGPESKLFACEAETT